MIQLEHLLLLCLIPGRTRLSRIQISWGKEPWGNICVRNWLLLPTPKPRPTASLGADYQPGKTRSDAIDQLTATRCSTAQPTVQESQSLMTCTLHKVKLQGEPSLTRLEYHRVANDWLVPAPASESYEGRLGLIGPHGLLIRILSITKDLKRGSSPKRVWTTSVLTHNYGIFSQEYNTVNTNWWHTCLNQLLSNQKDSAHSPLSYNDGQPTIVKSCFSQDLRSHSLVLKTSRIFRQLSRRTDPKKS